MSLAVMPSVAPKGYQHIEYTLEKNKDGKSLQDPKNGEGFANWSNYEFNSALSSITAKVYTTPVYVNKSRWDSTLISGACLIVPYFIINQICSHFLPFMPQSAIIAISCFSYAPLCMAYHAIRMAGVTIYLFFHAIYDMVRSKGIKNTLKSHAIALVEQVKISLWGIIRAPYYALKFNVGHLYTLVSPRNGMVFVSKVEQAWNRNIPVREGYSLLTLFGNFERYSNFEGGGDVDKLRPDPFYLLRCYQPIAECRRILGPDNNNLESYQIWSESGNTTGTIKQQKKDSISCIPDVIRIMC